MKQRLLVFGEWASLLQRPGWHRSLRQGSRVQALQLVEEFFDFVPYDYGPYSKEVHDAVGLLEQAGLVSEQRELADSPGCHCRLSSSTSTQFAKSWYTQPLWL